MGSTVSKQASKDGRPFPAHLASRVAFSLRCPRRRPCGIPRQFYNRRPSVVRELNFPRRRKKRATACPAVKVAMGGAFPVGQDATLGDGGDR
ncbi:hypothetical protein MTO96_031230 [Rhipicephalus appendiculatus]